MSDAARAVDAFLHSQNRDGERWVISEAARDRLVEFVAAYAAEQTAALRAALDLATGKVEGREIDDPARSLATMLSKMDDEDKAAFNWWHRQAKAYGAREVLEQIERSRQYADALLAAPEDR